MIAAVARHLRTGGGGGRWPGGLLPGRTVYGWFRPWVDQGLFETLMRAWTRRLP